MHNPDEKTERASPHSSPLKIMSSAMKLSAFLLAMMSADNAYSQYTADPTKRLVASRQDGSSEPTDATSSRSMNETANVFNPRMTNSGLNGVTPEVINKIAEIDALLAKYKPGTESSAKLDLAMENGSVNLCARLEGLKVAAADIVQDINVEKKKLVLFVEEFLKKHLKTLSANKKDNEAQIISVNMELSTFMEAAESEKFAIARDLAKKFQMNPPKANSQKPSYNFILGIISKLETESAKLSQTAGMALKAASIQDVANELNTLIGGQAQKKLDSRIIPTVASWSGHSPSTSEISVNLAPVNINGSYDKAASGSVLVQPDGSSLTAIFSNSGNTHCLKTAKTEISPKSSRLKVTFTTDQKITKGEFIPMYIIFTLKDGTEKGIPVRKTGTVTDIPKNAVSVHAELGVLRGGATGTANIGGLKLKF